MLVPTVLLYPTYSYTVALKYKAIKGLSILKATEIQKVAAA